MSKIIDKAIRTKQEPYDISVLIPTRKNIASLESTLASVMSQATSIGYEIIVLDNGCDPVLQDKVTQIAQRSAIRIKYKVVPEPGLHCGRHAGAYNAQSDLLLYVDDDIIADPAWLQAIVEAFADPAVQLVGGRNLPHYATEPPAWVDGLKSTLPNGGWALGYLSLLDLGDKPITMDPNYIWGLNFAIRKEALKKLGGFNPDGMPWELRRYRGDGESAVTRKAKAFGLKAVYRPDALVYHQVPKSRLTVEYFERRAHLQGISDSYTYIRQNRGVGPLPWPAEGAPWLTRWGQFMRRLPFYVRHPLRHGRIFAQHFWRTSPIVPRTAEDEELRLTKQRVARAYREGYEFHRDAVRRDPQLLEWVLREDYWDYRLPLSAQEIEANSLGIISRV